MWSDDNEHPDPCHRCGESFDGIGDMVTHYYVDGCSGNSDIKQESGP